MRTGKADDYRSADCNCIATGELAFLSPVGERHGAPDDPCGHEEMTSDLRTDPVRSGFAAPARGSGSKPGLLLDSVDLGTVEIHRWRATVADIKHSHMLLFDLDPGDRIAWNSVVETAFRLRGSARRRRVRLLVEDDPRQGPACDGANSTGDGLGSRPHLHAHRYRVAGRDRS